MTGSILITIPFDEFETNQKRWINEVLDQRQPITPPTEKKETYGSRKDIAKALKISLPTLYELTKSGELKGYRIGGRVLYKWAEVELSLIAIQSDKFKRR